MSVVRISLKDAIKISLEKERMAKPTYKKFDIYKHAAGMSAQDEEMIIGLWLQGNTYMDISKETGYCYATVGKKVRSYKNNNFVFRANCLPRIRMVEA